jgi:signal transduction histidine kinase
MEVALRRINEELEERVAQRTAALAAALADVQRAGKMKDEFMAMVSHELRTPLTGVLTMAEVLETQHAGSLTERQLRYVQAIRTSGERLHALVNSILSYTDLVAGNVVLTPGPCRLAQLCAEAAAGVRARAEAKQQTVEVHVAPPDLGMETDAGALRQVINRLLANAVKFTPEGGQIGIEARVGRIGAREGAWGPGVEGAGAPHVEIVVWDTGIGLQSELLPEVVKPFVQADAALARSHEGVGMGLAYVHQMLLLMGGTLALESAPHAGSRFIVSLPQRMAVQPAAHTVDAVPA